MKRTSWLNGFWHSMQHKTRRRVEHQTAAIANLESMESRQLLSTSALFIPETGELNIELGTNDNVRVRAQNGNVRVEQQLGNGSFAQISSVGTLSASLVRSIVIVGGDEGNTIDLSNVTTANYPSLVIVDVDAGNGHDTIIGSPELNDSLNGGHGDDTLIGQGGNDTLIGNDGNDSITAGAGHDVIRGGDGQDFIAADAGNDSIEAGDGTDTVICGDGNDSVFAGNGQDSLDGGAGNDTLNGDGGTDTLHGGDGNDSMLGGELNDLLLGDAGDDTLLGQAGNDTLIGVLGADRADGGAGNDVIQSALDVPVDDPIPAPAPALPSITTPGPLLDATDSTAGMPTGQLTRVLTTGSGDGSLSVLVTATGAFGDTDNTVTSPAGAIYDPIGNAAANETTLNSNIYFRSSTTTGTRGTLEALATNRSSIRALTNEANSSFDIGALHFTLTQLVEPVFDLVSGTQVGSLLTQTYHITNTGLTTSNFELARYFDGELQFDGSLIDGGGRFASAGGDEFLVETDSGGLTNAADFVAITSKGGTVPTPNRFEMSLPPTLQAKLQSGFDLSDQILNDMNTDQTIDMNFDVSMALRNTYGLAGGESAVYTTHTVFGSGALTQMQFNQRPVAVPDAGSVLEGSDIAIDVVSNDSDIDGTLDYLSIVIAQQPANGTVTVLADGRVVYAPRSGFLGTDTFVYTISDNLGAPSNPAAVIVTVREVDDVGDSLNGGIGNDTMTGAAGDDTIFGGAGQDSILGGAGGDRIQGQGGQDTIFGGTEADRIDGGEGNDLILNNEPIVIVADVNVTEGDSGITLADFVVTLSAAGLETVTVNYVTIDGTATSQPELTANSGSDYGHTAGTLTFAPGETTKTVSIPISGDLVTEYNEVFSLRLSDATNGLVGTPRAVATIVNDDGPVLSRGQNVNVSRLPFNQAEVTLVINPGNPLNLIAAANNLDDTATNDITWVSLDGGQTWTLSTVPNAAPPSANTTVTAGGDPTIVFDRNGIAYYSHLTRVLPIPGTQTPPPPRTRVETVRSFDGGRTWTSPTAPPVPAPGQNASPDVDKEFLASGPDRTDPTRDRIYLAYQQNNIQFIQSSLDGINWSTPVRVQDLAGGGINAQPSVGPNGEVYLAWQDFSTAGNERLMFDRSLDGGLTWGVDLAAYTTNVNGFIDPFNNGLGLDGIADGEYEIPAQPERGIYSAVAIDVDRSNGPRQGRIYMVFNDQGDLDGNPDPNNAADHHDTDIFLVASDDGGSSWTALGTPIRINDDTTTNSQFHPWIDVDPNTGNIAIGWYDTRRDLGTGSPSDTDGLPNTDVEFYVTTSVDGGQSFAPNLRLSEGSSNESRAEPYPPGFNNFDFGEYVGVAVLNGVVYGAWSDNSNSTGDNPGVNQTQDVYFAAATLVPPNTAPDLLAPNVSISDGNDTLLGNSGEDTIFGGGQNDLINGGSEADLLLGLGGNDSILGGSGKDTLLGGEGNDTLDGQGGDDVLDGGEGDDVGLLTFGGGDDTINNSGGLDVATVNADNTVNTITVSQVAIVGQAFNQMVVSLGTASLTVDGSVQYTVVNALGGNDTVTIKDLDKVSGSVLTVNGGDGNDNLDAYLSNLGIVRMRMNGEAGNDTLNGSLSGETLDGGTGEDSLCGWAGDDTMLGGDGNDTLGGSLGNDTLDGGDGADLLNGQQGNDSVFGSLGHDTLKGDIGDDTLSGGAGDDQLNGMAGDDSLFGGVGRDALTGGIGNDTLDGGRNDDTIGGNAGDDLIRGDHGHDQINGGDGNNTILGGDGNDTITSGTGNDIVVAGDGHDRVNTDDGDDVILGGDGNDTLNGGGGQDIILGGDGNDVINGQGGTDTVAGNQGVDAISDPLAEINEAFVLGFELQKLLQSL